MNVYWIWAPTSNLRIGITEDGKLVSTASITTAVDEPAEKPAFDQVTDEDIKEFEEKERSDELKFQPGKLPKEYIEETYKIIDEYYRTVKDYKPTITPKKPEKIKALPHGPHYIVTPPVIQTDEAAAKKILELIAKISEKSKEISIPRKKIEELFNKLTENGLTFYRTETTKELDNVYIYFNCCGFRWVFNSARYTYMLATGNMMKTRMEVAFSPRNDIDVLMFYKKMKEHKVYVADLEEFRKEFEETFYPIPTGSASKKALEEEKKLVLARSYDYAKEIAAMINKLAAIWKCAMG